MKNVLVRLNEYAKDATEAETNVFEYIWDHADQASVSTIHQLARDTYSSASTIIRLCKKLGFDGYKDFTRSLTYELANRKAPEINYDRDIEENDGLEDVIDKIVYRSMAALEKTRELVDLETVQKCAKLIDRSRRISLFGVGSSLLVAKDAHSKFMRVNKMSCCEEDFESQLVIAKNMNSEEVGIIISYSGLTREMLDIAAILKKHKVPVIAITRFAESDLSVMADYKLWVASSEYLVRSAAMTSRLAQLHVIDILYSAYIKLDYENNIERIEKTQMKKVRS